MPVRVTMIMLAVASAVAAAVPADAKQRSAADQALYEKARAACNGPQWPNGSRITINYGAGWYRCDPPSNY